MVGGLKHKAPNTQNPWAVVVIPTLGFPLGGWFLYFLDNNLIIG